MSQPLPVIDGPFDALASSAAREVLSGGQKSVKVILAGR